MVAYLQEGAVEDDRLAGKTLERAKPAGLPLTHEAALKWFYKDPQGEMQGEPDEGKVFWSGIICVEKHMSNRIKINSKHFAINRLVYLGSFALDYLQSKLQCVYLAVT